MNVRPIIIDINSDKILDIVSKINKFVEAYAVQKEFLWVYDTYFSICIEDEKKHGKVTYFILKRFDFEREFYHNGLHDIYENSPFDVSKTMYEVIQIHMNAFYPHYYMVECFIKKLLYHIPEKVTMDDFKEINNLYKSIKYQNLDNMTEYIRKQGVPNPYSLSNT